VHFHGYPNAAPVFDGNPDNSISVNQAATLTYYYVAPLPGTYMYHCHVEATEHMQMGMLANLYVRARQDRCGLPGNPPCGPWHAPGNRYAYNDGDGSTRYDVDYPIQIGSFDPAFHDASFGVQPLPFAGMRDRYFMLNGRGYPDTVTAGSLPVAEKEGNLANGTSQNVSSLITANAGQRILLRISNLNVTQISTLATIGIPMRVVGIDARLLRGDDGLNQSYLTNSITIGGGQSVDVILDTTGADAGKTYFLYTTNLDRLANNTENFGGMMTEIRVN
jgi:FtsP/CotA-like multicopper oxidase with cupredoxin domain